MKDLKVFLELCSDVISRTHVFNPVIYYLIFCRLLMADRNEYRNLSVHINFFARVSP